MAARQVAAQLAAEAALINKLFGHAAPLSRTVATTSLSTSHLLANAHDAPEHSRAVRLRCQGSGSRPGVDGAQLHHFSSATIPSSFRASTEPHSEAEKIARYFGVVRGQ